MRFDMQLSSWRFAVTQAFSADVSAAGAGAPAKTAVRAIANNEYFIETLPKGTALPRKPSHAMQYLRNRAGYK
jgi:hypothetical protein